jgi:hypothetical protein
MHHGTTAVCSQLEKLHARSHGHPENAQNQQRAASEGQLSCQSPLCATCWVPHPQVVYAEESEWSGLIKKAASEGAVSEPDFMEALQRRMESTVLGLQSGSYAQRVQVGGWGNTPLGCVMCDPSTGSKVSMS